MAKGAMTKELGMRIRVDGEEEYTQQLSNIRSRMKTLNSELDLCSARMNVQGKSTENLKAKQNALNEQLTLQRDRLNILKDMLEKTNEKYGEGSKQSEKLRTQFNYTSREVLNLENSLDQCNKEIKDFEKTSKKTTGSHEKLKTVVKGVGSALSSTIVAGAKAATAALAAVGTAAVASATQLWQLSGDSEAGMAQLAAQTGASREEMQELGEVARQVYQDNFGDSLETVAADLATVRQNTKLTGDALKEAAEAGYMLQDTFGMDQVESSRAAAAMMEKFGISARDAYNLISVGAQKGANQNGDLLDVLSEYAPHYAAMGLSADQMMQTLINGAQAGVFQIDKVGDAMKEFSIRAIDGSETTKEAFEQLDLNAQAVSSAIAQGGPVAQASFQLVVESLQAIEDPLKRNQIAVALFGTQYEDLGAAALPVLAGIADTSDTAVNALGQINNVKYDTFEAGLEGVKRQIEGEFLPLADTARQTVTNMLSEISGALSDGFQPEDVQLIGETIATNLLGGIQQLSTLLDENLEFVNSAMSVIVDTAAAALPALLDTLLPAAMGLLQSVLDSMTENIEPISNLASDLVTSIADFLIENAPNMVNAAGDLLTGLVDGLLAEGNLSELASAAVEMIGSLGGALVENAIELAGKAPEIIKQLVTGLLDKERWAQVGQDLIGGLLNGIEAAVTGLLGDIAAPFVKILDKIRELFGIHSPSTVMEEVGDFILQGLSGGLLAGVQAVLDTVADVFGRVWNAIKNVFGFGSTSDESKEAKQAGKDIMTGMQEGIAGDEDELKDKIRSVSKNALKTFRTEFGIDEGASTSTKLQKYGRAIVQGMLDGIEEKAGNGFQGAAADTARNAMRTFESELGIYGGAASKFAYIGTAICDGIVNGIERGTNRVSAVARQMAQAAYNAAKRELGVNSPSTKFEYLADMSIEGYTRSLNARMSDVRRSVQGLKAALNNGMVSNAQASSAVMDYDALAAAVTRSMKERGLGVVVLSVDGKELGRSVETGVSQQQYSRAGSTVVGRSSRLVLV